MDELEILLVTYNRAEPLRHTLGRLLESPFSDCKLTVLDNSSTDETPAVCREFERAFPRMRTIRHRRNLGFGGNYLRAVELAAAPYVWIMADDDDYDFSDVDDVLGVLQAGSADVLALGAPGRETWPRGTTTSCRRLLADGQRLFFVLSFLPNTIFRTSLVDSTVLAAAYANIGHLYPQFPLIERMVREDATVYVSRGLIVYRRGGDPRLSQLYWMHAWIASCDALEETALKRLAAYEFTPNRWEWVRWLCVHTASEALHNPETVRRRIADLAIWLRREQRLVLALVVPVALLPHGVVRAARRLLDIVVPGSARPVGGEVDSLRMDA